MRELLGNDWHFINRSEKGKRGSYVILPYAVAVNSKKATKQEIVYNKTVNFAGVTDKYIYLCLDGFVGSMTLQINKVKVGKYEGNGLPLVLDISKYVAKGRANTFSFIFTNSMSKGAMQKRSAKGMADYYIGLIDKVWIETCSYIHFVRNETGMSTHSAVRVSDNEFGTFDIDFDLRNDSKVEKRAQVFALVTDMSNRHLAQEVADVGLKVGVPSEGNRMSISVPNATEWTPENPYLYNIILELVVEGVVQDRVVLRKGFAKYSYVPAPKKKSNKNKRICTNEPAEGLYLNDRPFKVVGTDYYPIFPLIGLFNDERAIARDIFKLKKAGINTIKCTYMPASVTLLDVCDQLGMMVVNALPDPLLRKDKKTDDMVELAIRDAGRTCISMWEVTPSNATSIADGAAKANIARLKEAFGEDKMPLTIGLTNNKQVDLPYFGYMPNKMDYAKTKKNKHMGIVTNYGADRSKILACSREEGEERMLYQAWDYQYMHNRNMAYDGCIGDIMCGAIDRHNEMFHKNSNTGLMDEYRVPKISYYFYVSQNESIPTRYMSQNENVQPPRFCYVPTFWNNRQLSMLPIYTNCEQVKLYLNGRLITKATQDDGNYVMDKKQLKKFKKLKPTAYLNEMDKIVKHSGVEGFLKDNMYANANADGLKYPPIVFEGVDYDTGELVVDGIDGDEIVARHIVRTPGEPAAVRLRVDYCGQELAADGKDFVFVHADIIDFNGTLVNNSDARVNIFVSGGQVIGKKIKNAVAGVASFIVRADKMSRNLMVMAGSPNLTPERKLIRLQGMSPRY